MFLGTRLEKLIQAWFLCYGMLLTLFKRYRKSTLEEYQLLCGLGKTLCAGSFREDVGDFIIQYHLMHNKFPSLKLIVEHFIPEDELKHLDILYNNYLQYKNNEISVEKYEKLAEEVFC